VNWLHTKLAQLIDLRRVDPKVLAQIKIELQSFNARRKQWSPFPVRLSDD
jgi:hypothetical protein